MSNNTRSAILLDAEDFIELHFKEKVDSKYVYHNIQHVQNVVDAAHHIAAGYSLTENEKEILELAAWFHDAGYSEGPEQHEERSALIAAKFLKEKGYEEEKIERVSSAILDTKYDAQPTELLNQILRDADLSHLGSVTYWDNCGKV
ncbi:MAG: HD domain-containing protein, partial [Bacteroidota bacterium]